MKKVLIIFFCSLQFAFGEINWILDKIEKCLPNERFNYIRCITSQKASDDTFYQQFKTLANNTSVLVGIQDRYKPHELYK